MHRRGLGAAVAVLLLAASPAARAQGQPAQEDAPVEPKVDDPLLAPAVRAQTEIATWDDALTYVRARSTDLRIALLEVRRAEGQSRVALAGYLPTINATGSAIHNFITNDSLQIVGVNGLTPVYQTYTVPTANYLTGSLVGTQPIFAPRAYYAIGTAEMAEDVARLNVEDVKRQIALGVANAIVGVVTAERLAELNRVGLRNALQRLAITQAKAELGGAMGLDVVRSRQDVEVARDAVVAGDENLRAARESLGLALGVPGQIGVAPNVDIGGLEAAARAACKVAPKIDDRPDIASLHEQVEVAHRAVTDVKLQFSPTVGLQTNVSTTTIDTGTAPNTTWSIQGVLSLPIWDGGARYGNLRVTRAQELQAVEKLEASRRAALVQVEQAHRAVVVADDRRRVATSTRDLAAETDRLTRISFREGRGTSLELITAAQALRDAEIQLALREFDLVKARVLDVMALASCPW